MMTEMRHNFAKNNALLNQVIEFLRQNMHGFFKQPEKIMLEHINWMEKPWHSSTYDGCINCFTIRLSHIENANFEDDIIDRIALNKAIEAHEFTMRKSFVAAIKISKIQQEYSSIDMDIEAMIIFEE